jgi:serine/threonine protein kinase
MSPEQAQGHDLDGRSDIYALGVVLFEMLTGVRPFEGETPYSVAVKHVTEAPPSPCEINVRLPRAVDPVLFKVLAKSREGRYQTAGELAAALKSALEEPAGPPVEIAEAPETEPSLNEALRAGMARRAAEAIPPAVPRPSFPSRPVTKIRPPSPSPRIEVMPAYVPSRSLSYTGPLVKPRRRPKASRFPSWMTWATVAMLVGGLLLAVALAGVYYAINSNTSTSPAPVQEDYDATAIFKLTATKDAILSSDQQITGSGVPTLLETSEAPTMPPTNTPRPLRDGLNQ